MKRLSGNSIGSGSESKAVVSQASQWADFTLPQPLNNKACYATLLLEHLKKELPF